MVGCSVDSVRSHQRFAEKQGLEFPLISDAGKTITSSLGVLNERGNSARRTTLVVDRDGIVQKIFEDVKVPGHVEKVLEAVRKLV
ncbi:alkyl hydroperoxide reductase [Limnochorda pilosa]|uniref:Bacterioferritin comigratory protein n=1 Tax=Limnochorda pilosa TaxID=1555112 RepID=A0A0K2SHK4_LIMPI|nr:alkyl hydroperoxide reductase [Limnochorda pilosa]